MKRGEIKEKNKGEEKRGERKRRGKRKEGTERERMGKERGRTGVTDLHEESSRNRA